MLPVLAVAALLQASDPAPPASPAAPAEVTGAPAPTGSKRSARKSATHGKIAATDPAPASSPAAAAPVPSPASVAGTAAAAAADAAAAKAEEDDLLVRQKCGKCHDVSLAFSAELSDVHWKAHMKRMARVPGAAITDEQAKRIHVHLKAVSTHR
jgi:hypothetical protein